MTDSPQRSRSPSAAGVALHLVGLGLSLLLLAPLWLDPGIGDVDPSWQTALHDAFARGRQFGVDVVWTYGPWGLLWNEVHHPETWTTVLAVRGFFAITWWFALHAGAGHLTNSRRGQAALALSLLLIPVYSWDSIAYQGCAIVWLLWRSAEGRRELALATAFLAALCWLALGKFLLFLCLGAVVALSVARDGGARRSVVLSATWVLSTGAAWLAAGQHAATFPAWLGSSWEVASGFAQALTRPGARIEVVAYWGFALLILAAGQRLLPRFDGWRARLFDVAALLAPTATALRHSFTRHDTGHVLIGASYLFALAVMLLPAARRGEGSARIWRVTPVAVVLGLLCLTALLQPVDLLVETNRPVLQRIPGRLETGLALARRDAGPFERIEGHRAALAAAEPLGPIEGPVDILPHAQATLLRHDVTYLPRPVIQSNTAYTPRLNQLNAAHLASPEGPRTVLFDIDTLEDHHPAAPDSLGLLELLRHFDLTDASGRFVNLERRDAPRSLTRTRLLEREVAAGEWIELPSTRSEQERSALWLTVRKPRAPFDRLVQLVWKHRLIRVDVQHVDGDLRSWFVAPGVASSGLVVAPSLVSRLDFARLFVDEPDRRPVRAIRLGLQGKAPGNVRQPFSLAIDRIGLPGGAGADVPRPAGFLEDVTTPVRPDEDHPQWLEHVGGHVLFAHAPSYLEAALRPGLTRAEGPARAEVRFGLLPGAWDGEQPTDGVTFEVALRHGTSEVVLWQQRLSPTSRPADRHEQTAVFTVPGGIWQEPGRVPWDSARPKLVLRTRPGGSASSDWSYWSGLQLM